MMKFILSLMLQGVIPMFLGLGNNQWNGTAKTNEGQAQGAVGSYGSAAAGEGSALNPFFTQEMNAQHSLDPNQQNELLTTRKRGFRKGTLKYKTRARPRARVPDSHDETGMTVS